MWWLAYTQNHWRCAILLEYKLIYVIWLLLCLNKILCHLKLLQICIEIWNSGLIFRKIKNKGKNLKKIQVTLRNCNKIFIHKLLALPRGLDLWKWIFIFAKFHVKCQNEKCTHKKVYWHRPGVVIVNFEYISHLVLVFLLFTFHITGLFLKPLKPLKNL